MSITINDLDAAQVKTNEDKLIQLILEKYPTLDVAKGSLLNQLLIHPNAILATLQQAEIATVQSGMSLQAVSENPAAADTETVDALLSNYLIVRKPATKATGIIAVVFDTWSPGLSIPTTTAFTANGRTFYPTQNYTVVASPSAVFSDAYRVMQSRSDGKYWISIDAIESVVAGGTLVQGTEFTVSPEPANFNESYAAADFISGTAAESNEDLIQQASEGISAKAMADRVSISGLLKSNFPDIVDLSIIGAGDAEMSRDRYNVFGVAHNGRSDIYVRTAVVPEKKKFTILAPVTAKAGSYNAEFKILPTMAPGYYRVEDVTHYNPSARGSRRVSSYEPVPRGIYIPDSSAWMPLINTDIQAMFSKYQGSSLIRVTDGSPLDYVLLTFQSVTRTLEEDDIIEFYSFDGYLVSDYSVKNIEDLIKAGYRLYDVYVSYMPLLTDIQDWVNNRDNRAPVADYLIKGAIPTFVSVEITIGYSGTAQPDSAVVKSAVASTINNLRFTSSSLQTSFIADAVANALGDTGYSILPITLTGQTTLPDGSIATASSQSTLELPVNYPLGVSRRTSAFFCFTEDINITFKAESTT